MNMKRKTTPKTLADAIRNFALCQEFGEYLDLQHMLKLFILEDRTVYYRPESLKIWQGKRYIEAYTDLETAEAAAPSDIQVIGRSVRNLLTGVLLDESIDSVIMNDGYEIRKEFITALLSRKASLTA